MSQEIDVEMQPSPEVSEYQSQQGLPVPAKQTDLSECMVWEDSCIVLFTHVHTQNIHYHVAFRHREQCICLAWQINECLFSVALSFSP